MAIYKTPVTILQEMMVKLGEVPEYQCVAQTGPQHLSLFEYECKARGRRVRAAARSKKEAKQEAARAMLAALHAALPGPDAPGKSPEAPAAPGIMSGQPDQPPTVMSYVALLTEMCTQYRLPAPEYTLIGDTGPPHLRQFTVLASMGQSRRSATAATKKAARQQAAQDLYRYLRENLASLTSDFNESEALARVHERVMERYVEERGVAPTRDLSKRLDDCPRNVFCHLSDEKRTEILTIISNTSNPISSALSAASEAGLTGEWVSAGAGVALRLVGEGGPALAVGGKNREHAARNAMRLLQLAVRH